ncbi:unnamed protein product [Blepharisma stoltei]|uniref:Uncharacterized protein n=1 Tax=Blepharisma stoltei TaxID=1481888 RepID=A0AAU9JGU6_9CILI|nr:unnamed protein product [Blepharisma stoltei]
MNCLSSASVQNIAPLQTYWRNEHDPDLLISVFNTIDPNHKIFEIMKAGYLVLDRPIYDQIRAKDDACVLLLHAGYLTPYEK